LDDNLFSYCKKKQFTSDGEAKVKTISAADPETGAGAVEVACVRADISLKTGLRLAVAVRINKRAAAIAICNGINKIIYSG
jgi:hypothetical protein